MSLSSAELQAAQNSFTDLTWKADKKDQRRLRQLHLLSSSFCEFPFLPLIIYVNITVTCNSCRFCVSGCNNSPSPLTYETNEPKDGTISQGISLSDFKLPPVLSVLV